MDTAPIQTQPIAPQPKRYWRQIFFFLGLSTLFWLAQYAAQRIWLGQTNLEIALVRSFAYTGATLISTSLLCSAVFRWYPRWAQYWRVRRYLGVTGATYIAGHALAAAAFAFNFNLRLAYYSFDPLENPIIFGSLALPIFVIMACTSSDWAVRKLGARWKFIHRFVYLAFWAAIFHFVGMNAKMYQTPPGMLLLTITSAAVFGQVFWYAKTVRQRGWKKLGSLVGVGLILLTMVTAFLLYR